MYCKNCGSEIKEGNTFCVKCGNPIENISENIAQKEKKPKKKLVIISIIILVVIGIIITGVIAIPKVIHQIEEKKYQEEMQQDLNNINITLKVETIDLPSQGTYNQNLYDVEYPEILEKADDYDRYEQLVEKYEGGKLEITGNVDIKKIGEYEVNYTVTSEQGNTKTAKLKVKVKDYMKPEINIKNTTIQITKGTKVNILDGVTAEDNIDSKKELTARITTEGKVDVNKIGEYVITYKVKDTAGWATEKKRTYKVIEKPNIKLNTNYILKENGWTIYLKFISDSEFTYNAVFYYDGGTDSYKGTYTAKGNKLTLKCEEWEKYIIINNNNNTFSLDSQIYNSGMN